MRDWLRKRLDAYESRRERRDEELSELMISSVDAMDHRPTLKLFVYCLAGLNCLYWLSVLLVPNDVADAFSRVHEISDKVVATALAIVFGTGLWLTYAIFRLKFPDLEDAVTSDEVMSSFAYQQHSYRRIRIWMTAVAGGVLNLLALAVVEAIRSGS